jgi:hypothetical protein
MALCIRRKAEMAGYEVMVLSAIGSKQVVPSWRKGKLLVIEVIMAFESSNKPDR